MFTRVGNSVLNYLTMLSKNMETYKLGVPILFQSVFCCFVGLNFEPVLGRYHLEMHYKNPTLTS
jgi:hypothetical protein